MADLVEGSVTVALPDHLTIPEKAGKLSKEEVKRLPKARRSLSLACQMTAEAMAKNPERLKVHGVTSEELAAAGVAADGIDSPVIDAENATLILKQANLLIDAGAHTFLRRVLAHVRQEAKFGDPHILDLVPALIAYFANEPIEPDPNEPGA